MTNTQFALGLRWIARLAGLWMVLFLMTFVLAEGPPSISSFTVSERLYALGMASLYGGLAVAWFRPKWGGMASIGGWIFLAVVAKRIPFDWPMMLPASIGAANLLVSWALQNHIVVPPMPRRLAVGIFAPLGLFGILSANEIFGQPPLMAISGRAAVGNWIDAETRLVIGPDGEVSGTIGADPIIGARLVPNRSWFGKLMNWRSDYLIRGGVSGMQYRVFLNAESGGLVGSAEKGKSRIRLRLRAS